MRRPEPQDHMPLFLLAFLPGLFVGFLWGAASMYPNKDPDPPIAKQVGRVVAHSFRVVVEAPRQFGQGVIEELTDPPEVGESGRSR